MTEFIKIYGPPGTGKTETLRTATALLTGYLTPENAPLPPELHETLDPLAGHYSLSDVVFLTFTNSALDEYLERLGLSKDSSRRRGGPARYFRTVHGLALVLLIDGNVLAPEVLQNLGSRKPEDIFAHFCRKEGIRFNRDVLSFGRHDDGNLIWLQLGKAFNVYYPILQNKEDVLEIAKSNLPSKLANLVDSWENYKRTKGIIDYNDMLALAYDQIRDGFISFPVYNFLDDRVVKYTGKVFIVDEAQDLSPLQYEILRMLIKKSKPEPDLVLLAGDDDQAIYQFQGANPELFLKFPGKEIVLRRSWRNPNRVIALGREIVRGIRTRKEKEVVGHNNGKIYVFPHEYGFRRATELLEKYHLLVSAIRSALRKDSGSIMILTRNNSQATDLMNFLIFNGIPVSVLKSTSYLSREFKEFQARFSDFLNVLRRTLRGESLEMPDRLLLHYFTRYNDIENPEEYLSRAKEGLINLYTIEEEVREDPTAILDFERIGKVFGETPTRKLHRILENRFIGLLEDVPSHVKFYVDTIHASKGREADAVILLNDMGFKPFGKMWKKFYRTPEDEEAEKRLWYVGVTRARKWLYIISHARRGFPYLEEALTELIRAREGRTNV